MIDSQDNLRTAQEQTVDYQPGTVVFDKFKIIEKIGAGGMARVYKAEQIDLNRNVALKVLYSSIIDPRAIMRFQNEAKTTSKVVHQNIASILDFGVSKDGEPYMAMELIEGMTLQRWLSLEGKLNLDDFFSVFIQTADALAHAHEKGVIHRDITPGNIMIITGLDNLPIVKVLDFGVAKLVSKEEQVGFVTDPGTILGSPLYISPEQSRCETATPQTDLYSLGCVMYQCLVGKPPFDGTTAIEVFLKHREDPVPQITELEDTPPNRSLIAFLMKHLEKSPANRPSSASHSRDELARLQEQHHVQQSAKVATTEQISPSAKRQPTREFAIGIATICGATLLICAVFAAVGYSRGWFVQETTPSNTKIVSNLPFRQDYQHQKEDEIEQVLRTKDWNDASLKKYTKTSDELFTLPLANSMVTDDGLKYLTTQKSLRTLDLSSTHVHSLKYVKGISNLEDLDLTNCKLDSGALENLQNLSSLKLVILDNTNVTAQDVTLLAKNHSVNKVSVKSCPKIGPKELDYLQKEMPLCLVQPKELTLAQELAIYTAQENFEKCYSLAKAQVASMNKYDSPHIMKGLTQAAASCRFVGKFDESLHYVERQKLLAKKTGHPSDRLLANDSEIQHWAHANELERLIKAVDEDKEFRSMYRSESNEVIARNYDMIATVYTTKNQFGKAAEYEQQTYLLRYRMIPANAKAMELYGPRGIMTFVAKARLGSIYFAAKDYKTAKKHLRFLLNPLEVKSVDVALVICTGLLEIATISFHEGSYEDARLYCSNGIALCNKFPTLKDKTEFVKIVNNLEKLPPPPRLNAGPTT